MLYMLSALTAFLINAALTPIIISFSRKNKWFDPVNARKIHKGLIPRTGGVGIFFSFFGSVFLIWLLLDRISGIACPAPPAGVFPVAAGAGIMFITGILDDFKNFRARYKLVLQIIAAVVVIAAGYRYSMFNLPFGFQITSPFLTTTVTVLWVVGVTNAVNLIDGLDGLAGGITGIAAAFWGVLSLVHGHYFSAFLSFALFGSVTAFLLFNRPPAKLFMGDSGSLVLGFVLSTLPLLEKQPGTSTRTILLASTLLLVPIFDTLASILRRVREKKHIGSPDRSHMHHKLLGLGLSVPSILGMVYTLCIVSGAAALIWAAYPQRFNLYYLPLAWIPTAVFFLVLHYLHHDERRES